MSCSTWQCFTFFGILCLFLPSFSEAVSRKRMVRFSLCKGYDNSDTAVETRSVKSRLQCWKDCVEHPSCRAGTVCVQGDVMTCSLFSAGVSNCQTLTVKSPCTTAGMMDMCQNGGQYDKNSLTCDCPSGWEGPLCETAPTTEAITTTLLPLPAAPTTEAGETTPWEPEECFTDSACTPDMKYHRDADGKTFCCPPHATWLFMNCNTNPCKPCFCFY